MYFVFKANFKKECGADKKCLTDLRLKADFVDLIVGYVLSLFYVRVKFQN